MSAQPKGDYVAGTHGVVHQALRREVNEQISSINATSGVGEAGSVQIMCECIRSNCTASIVMTVREYETVRRSPTRFFVKEGHEVGEEERVVAESTNYIVIEAFGREGLYAVRADPRRRRLRSVEVTA